MIAEAAQEAPAWYRHKPRQVEVIQRAGDDPADQDSGWRAWDGSFCWRLESAGKGARR